jgi:hypothetical protein
MDLPSPVAIMERIEMIGQLTMHGTLRARAQRVFSVAAGSSLPGYR